MWINMKAFTVPLISKYKISDPSYNWSLLDWDKHYLHLSTSDLILCLQQGDESLED
jgi:hypothetical protein